MQPSKHSARAVAACGGSCSSHLACTVETCAELARGLTCGGRVSSSFPGTVETGVQWGGHVRIDCCRAMISTNGGCGRRHRQLTPGPHSGDMCRTHPVRCNRPFVPSFDDEARLVVVPGQNRGGSSHVSKGIYGLMKGLSFENPQSLSRWQDHLQMAKSTGVSLDG